MEKYLDVFKWYYVYYFLYCFNVQDMREVVKYFIGIYDFMSFCVVKIEVQDKVRMIYEFDWIEMVDGL